MEPNAFYDDDELTLAEHELLYQSVINHNALNKEAYRHIWEGFSRRLTMLQCSRLFLREHTNRKPTDPPSPYLIEEMNVHLNSYYINLRGCMDNLAWALNYRLALVAGTETDSSTRRKIDLFGKDFLAALKTQRPNLRDASIRKLGLGSQRTQRPRCAQGALVGSRRCPSCRTRSRV